jgi:sodium-dependent dicarboxylate transporter 2/3/5
VASIGLVTGLVVALALLLCFDLEPGRPEVTRTAAVALLMAIWWMTEAIPLAATALLPVVLFPLLGIMDGRAVAPVYVNHVVFLFLGGFVVALAMERWGLHERIALRVLTAVGTRPGRLLFGFMLASAFLSMWISNTATAMMMVPIAGAVLASLGEGARSAQRRIGVALALGIAYGASVGGLATLVGTPPNPLFVQVFAIQFPAAPEIGFARWLVFAAPLSVVFLLVAWVVLAWRYVRGIPVLLDPAVLRERKAALGPMSFEERVVLADFVALALLWMTRSDLELGGVVLPGWERLLPAAVGLNDGTVAVALALLLFVIPSRAGDGARVMDWETARGLPWGIVLLFGGGFALAQGFTDSGLSSWLGERLSAASGLHPLLLVVTICLMTTFLTELTSNTATAQMLLPVLAALSLSVGVHPLLLMVPGTLACSLAFMLPVATPPNAIVFGTGRVRIADMARTGFVLNLAGVVLAALLMWTLGRAVFGIELGEMPEWARQIGPSTPPPR